MPGVMDMNMTLDARQHFPLSNAYLCQDCNSIGNNPMHCHACASDVLMSLAGVLNPQHANNARNGTLSELPVWRPQSHIAI